MSSPICTSSPSIARSSTASQTKTRPAKKNLQDRWSASIIPSVSSSEETRSHSTDSPHTTTEVATQVLENEKSTRHKWTQKEKERLRDLLDENKTIKDILPILKSEFGIKLTESAVKSQLTIIKKSKLPHHKTRHAWTQKEKDQLWRLSKEDKSIQTIQLKLNHECGLTLTAKSIIRQLAKIREFNKIPVKTHHVWTKPEKDLLQTLSDKKESSETIQLTLEREFGMTSTISAINCQLARIKPTNGISTTREFNKIPIKTHHVWTKPENDLLQTLIHKKESSKNIQLTLERELRVTRTISAINCQLSKIKKLNQTSTRTHHMWTKEQKARLWNLSTEGEKPNTILPILEHEFKVTFTLATIKHQLFKLKPPKGLTRTPSKKKWSLDDLKILKAFLQKNSLASQKGSVEKHHHSSKNIFRGVNPEEWQKLATTLNRTVQDCLKAAHFSYPSQALARPLDSDEEASHDHHLAAAAPESVELEQLNADLERLLDRALENEPLFNEALLDYLV